MWWWTGGDALGALYGRATNERFALKTINLQGLTDDLHERVVNESLILARMHHQNIVKLYESLYLVMELLSGGELFDRLMMQPGIFRKSDSP